ncbi:B3 domain-containing transcription factor VRN1-like [Mercurialis annua]|uniref:B3 domain-containing transcription factor VRN1-like n=1 Tax=Mercurialis annua TaxID=3986 RepID=UPI0024AC89D9|nr:B3 domain-containing transcription factor VRN1-like [Mercurialis annua]
MVLNMFLIHQTAAANEILSITLDLPPPKLKTMKSCRCHSRRRCNDQRHSKVSLPVKFLKQVHRRSMQEKKLMLPSFTSHFGEEFSSSKFATLSFPNGFSTRVRLSKMENQKTCMDITKLVELGYINEGFILEFTYKGFSFFKVVIFDNSSHACLQIEYPCKVDDHRNVSLKKKNKFKSSIGQRTKKDGEKVAASSAAHGDYRSSDVKGKRKIGDVKNCKVEEDSDAKIETMGTKKKLKMSSAAAYPNTASKRKCHKVSSGSDHPRINKRFLPTDNRNNEQKYERKGKKCKIEEVETDLENFDSMNLKLSPESKRAVNAARKYKPKNPAFMCVIELRNIGSLYIPAAFYNKHLSSISRDYLTIQISDGKKWLREWLLRISRSDCGWLVSAEGWIRFSEDNGLSLGDVCVFELIDSKNSVFEASVFHASLDSSEVSDDHLNRKIRIKITQAVQELKNIISKLYECESQQAKKFLHQAIPFRINTDHKEL